MKQIKNSVITDRGRRDSIIVAALRLGYLIAFGVVLVWLGIQIGNYATGGRTFSLIIPIIACLFAATFAGVEIVYGGKVARAEEKRIRRDLLMRVFSSTSEEASDQAHVVQLATDNTERVTEFRQVYLGPTIVTIVAPFLTLGFVAVAFDWVLGLGIMVLCPLIPLLLGGFQKLFRQRSSESRKQRGQLAGRYLDAIRNLITIRLFGAGPRIEEDLRVQGEKNRSAIMKLLAGNQIVIIVLDGLFSLILICATTALTIARFNAGAVDLGQAIATMLLTVLLVEPLVQVAGFFYIGMGGIASQKAIGRYKATHDRASHVVSHASIANDGSISVDAVSYDYGRGEVLHEVSLKVPAGHRVAIIGRSGGGKTTLLRLLRGDLRPQSGSVAVSGNSLASLSVDQAHALSASVAQSTWLFTGSIADNLRLARPHASEEEMWQALKQAQVADEIERMPEGLHTQIGEQGGLISGGQAQRISIARALLSGRTILLLDEPTSQVDIESEKKIIRAISELGREWTIVVVTHRKALLALADLVYEMRQGELHRVNANEHTIGQEVL